MAVKNKRNSMTEALKDRGEVTAFLEAGKTSSKFENTQQEAALPSLSDSPKK